MSLPDFVPPMLAELGREPFDSDEHLFEIKWDGIRALSFVEAGGLRAYTRNANELHGRYPELDMLRSLEPGCVLDGELVVLVDGKPHFSSVLQREQARAPLKIQALARSLPATLVVFDVLYRRGRPLLDLPLSERREELRDLVSTLDDPHLVVSEGLVGEGRAFFQEIRRLELEGLVAKRLTSPYRPGKRSDAWTKIKTTREAVFAILGWLPDGEDDLKSLILGAEEEGRLVCVGRVGSGLSLLQRRRLRGLCGDLEREEPLVDCGPEGRWVSPGLFCRVSFLERTENGLRAPVFVELLRDDSPGPGPPPRRP